MKNALCVRKSIVSSPNEYIKSCEECEKQKLTEELGQKLFAAYLLQMENCNYASEYNAQQLRILLTWFWVYIFFILPFRFECVRVLFQPAKK